MSMLEKYCHEEPGFKSVFMSSDGWSVAISNGRPGIKTVSPEKFDRHPDSDEVFVLLRGECHFYTAGSDEAPGDVCETVMEPYKVYNVPRKTWHMHIEGEGTKLLIVENSDA